MMRSVAAAGLKRVARFPSTASLQQSSGARLSAFPSAAPIAPLLSSLSKPTLPLTPTISTAMFARRALSTSSQAAAFARLGALGPFTQRRFCASQNKDQQQKDAEKEGKGAEDAEGEKKNAEGKQAEEEQEVKGSFFSREMQAFKTDMKEFPDIYNVTNMLNVVLFTIFCLCSTGSERESDWWMKYFGIDATFMPTAWFLHSLLMNNFLSMSFSMILMHSMCHSVMPQIGAASLFYYLTIVSVASGIMMWAYNFATNNTSEKQFGPWDCVAALFVMQYYHQGFLPHTILLSFTGWIKYACLVGALCIVYYDYQPVACGTVLGLLLCKTAFKVPLVKPMP